MNNSTLWIAEKPSVAKIFATALNLDDKLNHGAGAYISSDGLTVVTWLYGHLLRSFMPEEYDPALKKWDFNHLPFLPDKWKVCPREEVKSHFFRVKKLIDAANNVVLATDYDREGEVIGRELLDYCGYRGKVERVNITATDTSAIKKCIQSRFDGDKGLPLYYAGKGRAQADFIVGLNITRAATLLGQQKGLQGPLTAGRVQSALLSMIVQRENEITHFTSQDHYQVQCDLQAEQIAFSGLWLPPTEMLTPDRLLLDKSCADAMATSLKGNTAIVTRCIAKPAHKNAPLPFSLSAAQIECANRFGFSADKTAKILQALYDTHSLTTYPRTSCRYLPTAQLNELDDILASLQQMDPTLGTVIQQLDLSIRSEAWNDEKVEAHYGLMPTPNAIPLSTLSDDEIKVYTLIRDNFISQFMPPATYRNVTLEMRVNDNILMANSSRLTEPGWMSFIKPVNDDNDEDEPQHRILPELAVGTAVTVSNAAVIAKKTQPPKHFTEATLLIAMNNCAHLVKDPNLKKILKATCGIGTEATRAGIIKALFDRGYTARKGKQIRPTELAFSVIDILPDEIKSVERTAYWEQQLDAIASRKLSLEAFIAEVKEMTSVIFKKGFGNINLDKVIPKCPGCGKNLQRRKHEKSFFWGCSGYPECRVSFNDKNGKPDFNKNKPSKKGKK